MAKKTTRKPRVNRRDATLRNVKASNKDDDKVQRQIRELHERISHLEDRIDGVG